MFKSNETEIILSFSSDARWTKTALDYVVRVTVCVLALPKTNNVPRCAFVQAVANVIYWIHNPFTAHVMASLYSVSIGLRFVTVPYN